MQRTFRKVNQILPNRELSVKGDNDNVLQLPSTIKKASHCCLG